MRKHFVAAALLAAGLAWAKPAAADTVTFDVDGSGGGTGVISATKFDWLPGNSLVIENLDQAGNPTGTGTVLFQANLGSIVATPLSSSYLNGTTGDYFTAVASFNVTINPTGFTVNPGGTFAIYADSAAAANDLAGTGFADGTLILSGSALFGSGSLTPTGATATLDQFEGDSYNGWQSIVGTGGFSVTVGAITVDSNYFLTNPNQIIVSSVSAGSNNLPFTQVDPSAAFFNGEVGVTSTCGPLQVAPNCINGTGNRIIAESDASSTFATVPEPASLTLLGLGLAGAAARRRQQKKA